MFIETRLRSILKSVSWRFWATLTTMALIFIFTRRIDIALSVGALEWLSKMLIYFVHERIWNKISIGRRAVNPAVIWFTGLSGSGKSTISRRTYEALKKRGLKVEYLDGDSIRHLFPTTGFTKTERDMHIRRVGHLASTLEKNGIFVVASFISPYAESREFVRKLCRNFFEVYVSTPLEVCEKRDAKGLYAKARRGEIKNFTGIDDPYEPPRSAEIKLNTAEISEEEASSRVLAHVHRYCLNGSK